LPEQDAPETEAGYAHWDQKPALGRRGMILAVVIPVLIAAAAFGVVAWVSHGSETAATAIKVPTSSWIAGQPGGNTPIQGTLSVDSRRCVYLESAAGEIWPVWPAGFRARLDSSGKVSLYDGTDHLVARDGEEIRSTGQLAPSAAYAGETCLPSNDDVAVVQSEVTRTGT
jgi:hypothetical protein